MSFDEILDLRPMTMEKRDVANFSFQTTQKTVRLKIRSYRRYGKNQNGDFYFIFFMRLHAAEPVVSR